MKRPTKQQLENVVSSAAYNAFVTICIEKAQPKEQAATLAAASIQDSLESACIDSRSITAKQLASLEKQAAEAAVYMVHAN